MLAMGSLGITNARILTLVGEAAPRRGDALRELGVIERGFVRIEDGRIAEVAQGQPESQDEMIDAGG